MFAGKAPFKEFTSLLNPHSRRIVAGIGLSAIGRGMTLSLLMVYLHDIRGFSIAFGGVVLAWGALFGIICTPPLGSLVDRIGPKKVMLAGLVISGFSALAFAFVTTQAHALVAITLFAFGGQCVWPSQMVILTRVTPEKDRTKIFGFNFMLMNLGLGVGGFLSALIIRENSILSYQIMYFIDSLTYFAFIFFIWGLNTPHAEKYVAKEHEPEKGSYRELFAIKELSILTIAGIILLTFGYGPLQSGLPVYATQYLDLAPNWLGIIFGVNTFAIVAFQPLVLKMIANYSKYSALIAVAIIWALSWLAVGISPYLSMFMAGIALCVSQLIFAFGEMVHAPTSPALTQELAPEHIRGRASALTSLQWGISGIAGPAVAGLMIGANLEQLWVITMAIGVLAPIPLFAYLKRTTEKANK